MLSRSGANIVGIAYDSVGKQLSAGVPIITNLIHCRLGALICWSRKELTHFSVAELSLNRFANLRSLQLLPESQVDFDSALVATPASLYQLTMLSGLTSLVSLTASCQTNKIRHWAARQEGGVAVNASLQSLPCQPTSTILNCSCILIMIWWSMHTYVIKSRMTRAQFSIFVLIVLWILQRFVGLYNIDADFYTWYLVNLSKHAGFPMQIRYPQDSLANHRAKNMCRLLHTKLTSSVDSCMVNFWHFKITIMQFSWIILQICKTEILLACDHSHFLRAYKSCKWRSNHSTKRLSVLARSSKVIHQKHPTSWIFKTSKPINCQCWKSDLAG